MVSDTLRCGEPLGRREFDVLCQRALFDCFKWDVEADGQTRLCAFPIVVGASLLERLASWAVSLAAEALGAEEELLANPELQAELALPLPLRLALRRGAFRAGVRYSRFDFHPIVGGGFAISEGNLDVAGGLNDASGVAPLFADGAPGTRTFGDPAAAIARAVRASIGAGRTVGCLSIAEFTDDQQLVKLMARHLEGEGLSVVRFGPSQLRCGSSRTAVQMGNELVPLDAVYRFLPADWLPSFPIASRWWRSFRAGETIWVNPPTALLTQSKRFPLAWPSLRAPMPTWRRLLPETRTPGEAADDSWVMKPVFGYEGDRIGILGVTDRDQHAAIRTAVRRSPREWVAQRRFEGAPLATPIGVRYPCIGVYVVNGEAVGLYGRLAARPLIDDHAMDVAVLVE